MNKFIPALLILLGWIGVYAYQHRPQPAHISTTSYQVLRVIDGDTIDVSINGKSETVRMIGVDTPETVDPRKPVGCYGPEASAETKRLLEGKRVTLEADLSQGDRDKYGRLLRYVYLVGTDTSFSTHLNLYLIEQGFGREYTYSNPYKYQDDFIATQRDAEKYKRGLWGACN